MNSYWLEQRLRRIASFIQATFPGALVAVEKAYMRGRAAYIRLRATLASPGTAIVIREAWLKGRLHRYAYQLIAEGKPLLRYDNAPHHPEIETFPHHKHLEDRVEPLPSPSVEAFLKEARNLLEHRSAGKR